MSWDGKWIELEVGMSEEQWTGGDWGKKRDYLTTSRCCMIMERLGQEHQCSRKAMPGSEGGPRSGEVLGCDLKNKAAEILNCNNSREYRHSSC